MAKACGSEDTDDWIGKQVIVFVDENVSFGGELVGGLRIRKHKVAAPVAPTAPRAAAPQRQAAPQAAPASGFDDMADDIPFVSSAFAWDATTSKARRMARYDY